MSRVVRAPRRAPVFLGLLVVSCAWTVTRAAAGDPLYYEVDSGRVVFTNTPSSAAQPVPGMEPPPPEPKPARKSAPAGLPTTIYDPFIERVARENGLSPALIKAVALVESGFDPHAVSPKGAQGLMQLMPGTAREYGVDDALDPLQNLRAGSTHLRRLLDAFDGDLTLALAAYNAGAGAVRRHGGVPNYPETREYVRRVHANLGRGSAVAAGHAGGAPAAPKPPPREVHLVLQADGSVVLSN